MSRSFTLRTWLSARFWRAQFALSEPLRPIWSLKAGVMYLHVRGAIIETQRLCGPTVAFGVTPTVVSTSDLKVWTANLGATYRSLRHHRTTCQVSRFTLVGLVVDDDASAVRAGLRSSMAMVFANGEVGFDRRKCKQHIYSYAETSNGLTSAYDSQPSRV